MQLIPTISEIELYLHDQMRAFPDDEQSLLVVEAWVARRKQSVERRYPGRNLSSLPFTVLFEEEVDS